MNTRDILDLFRMLREGYLYDQIDLGNLEEHLTHHNLSFYDLMTWAIKGVKLDRMIGEE